MKPITGKNKKERKNPIWNPLLEKPKIEQNQAFHKAIHSSNNKNYTFKRLKHQDRVWIMSTEAKPQQIVGRERWFFCFAIEQ